MMALLADGGFLAKLACENTECMSYIVSFLDILTVLYLSFCASFRVTKGVRIFGWIWAAVVIAGTVTVVALHTCLFTLVSALFTALILMALFGVTFESIATKKKEEAEDGEKAAEKPAPAPAAAFVCPMAAFACPMAGCAKPAPVEEAPAPQEVKEEPKEEPQEEVKEEEPLTLKESLALAKESKKASDVINKKYVADFLTATFGEEVECNMRGNYTKTSLPLADTHYAIGKEGKRCFVYVYETDAAVVLLLRLSE